MDIKMRLLIAGIAVALVAIIAAPYFVPKDTVRLDQDMPPGDGAGAHGSDIETIRGGAWRDGDAAHQASGQIDLVTVDGVVYLRFSDFEMTAGPDVYLYLTKDAPARSTSQVEGDGIRVDVSTDADKDARLNERGTFFVPLEIPLADLDQYQGVTAWCDDFNVVFGTAILA